MSVGGWLIVLGGLWVAADLVFVGWLAALTRKGRRR